MPGPIEIFVRLLLAGVKIGGYLFVCLIQSVAYAINGRPDKIADSFGYLGRGSVDAIVEVFRRRD